MELPNHLVTWALGILTANKGLKQTDLRLARACACYIWYK